MTKINSSDWFKVYDNWDNWGWHRWPIYPAYDPYYNYKWVSIDWGKALKDAEDKAKVEPEVEPKKETAKMEPIKDAETYPLDTHIEIYDFLLKKPDEKFMTTLRRHVGDSIPYRVFGDVWVHLNRMKRELLALNQESTYVGQIRQVIVDGYRAQIKAIFEAAEYHSAPHPAFD